MYKVQVDEVIKDKGMFIMKEVKLSKTWYAQIYIFKMPNSIFWFKINIQFFSLISDESCSS